MKIVIFGQRSSSTDLGHFAKAIIDASKEFNNVILQEPHECNDPDIIVYASRSIEQFEEAATLAKEHSVPLLVVSTDIKDELSKYKEAVDLHYYPNTSLHTIEFMEDVKMFHIQNPTWHVASFIEWHQESKKSMSGTAIAIAETIDFDASQIVMIRDDARAQKEMNIPKGTDAYAVHTLVFADEHSTAQRTFSLTTIGRDEYARGVIEIAKKYSQLDDT